MKFEWIIKIDGRKLASGISDSQAEAISEVCCYMEQYCGVEINKINVEIKRK